MPLRVSFELSDSDLRYFRRKMRETTSAARGRGETEIIEATASLLEEIRHRNVPDFVRERIAKLRELVQMLEDAEWQLSGPNRKHVLSAMAYFAEAEDLIPDVVPGIGFLDDAIMVELVVQELRNELDAYRDFCAFRSLQERERGRREDGMTREEWLRGRRAQLHGRIRRRLDARRSRTRRTGQGEVPFRLF